MIFSFVIDDYLERPVLQSDLISVAITAVLAAGEAVVIITRKSTCRSVRSSVFGVPHGEYSRRPSGHAGRGRRVATAIGALLGLVNGVLVAFAKVPAIIVTLGTLAIYRSLLTTTPVARRSSPPTCRLGRRPAAQHPVQAR